MYLHIQQCILDIDIQGAIQVKASKILDPLVVFIHCPSFEELEKRLRGRGTESEESIRIRLETAKREEEFARKNEDKLFDEFIVNDELPVAYDALKGVIQKHIPQLGLLNGASSPSTDTAKDTTTPSQ